MFVDVIGRRADGTEAAQRAVCAHPTAGISGLTAIGLVLLGERVAGLRGAVTLPPGEHMFDEFVVGWLDDLLERAALLGAPIKVSSIDPKVAERG